MAAVAFKISLPMVWHVKRTLDGSKDGKLGCKALKEDLHAGKI